jgi:hypothetical protein
LRRCAVAPLRRCAVAACPELAEGCAIYNMINMLINRSVSFINLPLVPIKSKK